MMKLRITTILLLLFTFISSAYSEEIELPRVEILGEEYYYYEIDKDDSVYGVCRHFGWEVDELSRLNPHTISTMKKGERLYYPVNYNKNNTAFKESPDGIVDDIPFEPITHLVKKGETVYGISRLYGIPVELIYKNHPSAKHGIKAGETIVIDNPGNKDNDSDFLFYQIKQGDTLYAVSNKYGTSVKELMTLNPGLTEKNFKAGETIRIRVNSNKNSIHKEVVEEEKLLSVDNYKVRKDDTWRSISKRTGVDEERLREFNEASDKPKKDEVVSIPVTEMVKVEKEYVEQDPRSLTEVGRQELYDDVHNVATQGTDSVSVVVLLEDPTSRKDLEFVRGMLVAIDDMKSRYYKLNLKIIDCKNSSQTSVLTELDEIKPHLIICTADKNLPEYVVDYGNKNMVEVLNVFDVRNEQYINNPSVVQLMPPSNLFNESICSWIKERNADSRLLMVGNPDDTDAIASALLSDYDEAVIDRVSIADFLEYDLNDIDSYLIYAYPTKKEEAVEILNNVEKVSERSPLSKLVLIGRPNWITFADAIKDKLYVNDVYIPSRFCFDSEEESSKNFLTHYVSMFGQNPVKSFPMYSVTGYDVANTFVPGVVFNGGDMNKGLPVTTTLQTEIELQRINNWGGFVNPVVFMLHYGPYKDLEKIIVR